MSNTQYPRLADPSDIPRLVTHDRVSQEWPPPGTTVHRYGFPEAWVLVTGQPTDGEVGDWYVTSLSEVALGISSTPVQLLAQLGRSFTGPIAAFAGAAGQWPVIYEVGRNNAVRYLKSTFRGTLGGIEQFQYQMCWGKPGDDPTTDEAGQLALATDLAAKWKTVFMGATGGSQEFHFSPEVVWTEVGVVEETITDNVEADGSGGNLAQSNTTQWYAWPLASQPKGVAATVSLPFEVACAVTLQTDKRGPSGRGRFYLPPFCTAGMQAGGKWTDSFTSTTAASVGAFFQAVEAAHSGLVPVVVSKRHLVLNEVKSVNTGKIPDSQRRRRNAQDEARITGWTKP